MLRSIEAKTLFVDDFFWIRFKGAKEIPKVPAPVRRCWGGMEMICCRVDGVYA